MTHKINTKFFFLVTAVFLAFGLTACGGGGTTPVVTAPEVTTPEVTTPVVTTPEVTKPVVTTPEVTTPVVTRPVVTVPEVTTPVVTNPMPFELGTRDPEFNMIDGVLSTTEKAFPDGISFAHRRLEGPIEGDPRVIVELPPRDVREQWHAGWSGQGVNILILDDFGLPGRRPDSKDDERGRHGYVVALAAFQTAPSANYFGFNAGFVGSDTDFGEGGFFTKENTPAANAAAKNQVFDVLNMSFGPDVSSSSAAAQADAAEYQQLIAEISNVMTMSGRAQLSDAVLTLAAGNDGTDAGFVASNRAFTTDRRTAERILIVGALADWAQNGAAALASYSNVAGATAAIRNRFLVEYGGSPYIAGSFLCDSSGAANTCNNLQELTDPTEIGGTSFAAPRVAGLAALLRDKFPNLTGPQTAFKLLDTATYNGLICAPHCPVTNYGRGRVDIGAALAPSGPLQ